MNLQDVSTAFQKAYVQNSREGLSVKSSVQDGEFHVEVRHKDAAGELRGFDVSAQPTASERKTAEELGKDVAEVVERELGYGQLSAAAEDGTFKRIVV